MKVFVLYTNYCYEKVNGLINKGDIVFLDDRICNTNTGGLVINFSLNTILGRLKFYALLRQYLLSPSVKEIYFHNYTDYSFYLIYNTLKYESVDFNYISDGIGSFLSRGVIFKRFLLIQLIYFIQTFKLGELPPLNFLICFNVKVIGKESIEVILKNTMLSTLDNYNSVLFLDNFYYDIFKISEDIKFLRMFSKFYVKMHPLKLTVAKDIFFDDKKVICVYDLMAFDFDLYVTFFSTSIIELIEKRPSLRMLVLFPYTKKYSHFRNVSLYEQRMFTGWNKKCCDSLTMYSNFNLDL